MPSRSEERRGAGEQSGRRGGGHSRGCTLFVRNISDRASGDEIKRMFERYGNVVDVTIPLDYYSREPKGFCFVEFEDPRDAEDAFYDIGKTKFHGREIEVEFARGERKTPADMRHRDRGGDRRMDGRRRRSRSRGSPDDRRRYRSRSRSRRRRQSYSRSPVDRRRSRSYTPPTAAASANNNNKKSISPTSDRHRSKRDRSSTPGVEGRGLGRDARSITPER